MKNRSILEKLPLGKLFSILTKGYAGVLTQRLNHLDISRHYSILILIHHEGSCCQQFISDQLQIDKVTMVHIIQQLLDQGLIVRERSNKDKRKFLIKLSPKAKKMIRDIVKAAAEVNNESFAGFTEKERNDFYSMMSRINANLESLPANRVFLNFTNRR